MSQQPAAAGNRTVIWKRDTTPTKRGWLKWAALGIAAVCGFGTFAQYMSPNQTIDGTFIGLGVILLGLLALYPWLNDRNKRLNPEVALEAGELVWAKKRVPLDQIESYGLHINRSQVYNGRSTIRMSQGVAGFTLSDGEIVQFVWPYLDQVELDLLGEALDPFLPGRRSTA